MFTRYARAQDDAVACFCHATPCLILLRHVYEWPRCLSIFTMSPIFRTLYFTIFAHAAFDAAGHAVYAMAHAAYVLLCLFCRHLMPHTLRCCFSPMMMLLIRARP